MDDIVKSTELTWRDLWRATRVPLGYVGERKQTSALLMLLAFVSAGMGAATPYMVGRFVDALIALSIGNNTVAWILPLAGWMGVVFVSTVVDWRLNIYATRMGHYVYSAATSRWFSTLLFLPIGFHKQHRGGEVINKLYRAGDYIWQLIDHILLSIGPQLLSMCIGLGFAYTLQPNIATAIVFGMVVYGVVSFWTALPIARLKQASNKAWSEAFGDAQDALANVQTVKQTAGEEVQREKIYEGLARKAFMAAVAPEILWNRITFLQRVAVMCTQLVVFLASVYFVSRGEMSVGGLVALNGYSALVFGPLARLASNWNAIQNGLTTIHDVEEIMEMKPEAYERVDGKLPEQWNGAINFSGISFSYPDAPERTILSDVSFSIKDGETIAFVGESGVGKSTAIELIGGYYYPTAGEVTVSGVATSKLPLRPLRERIAVVPQEPVLFNDTVISNIRFGSATATDEEVVEAAKKAYAHEFIETFPEKYNQLVGERGVKLSVGQKQRIAIARAILRDPRILILDEPTSALDAKTESQITTSLEELMRGRTTIIIAHRLSTVRKADNIVVFEGGKVVEQGKHADLIAKENGVYRKLYEYQIGLHA